MLAHQDHALCLAKMIGLQAVEVNAVTDRIAVVIATIPGCNMIAGAGVGADQRLDQLTGDVEDLQLNPLRRGQLITNGHALAEWVRRALLQAIDPILTLAHLGG